MDSKHLRQLLLDVQGGELGIDSALERMQHLPFEDIGFAKVDHHRALRHGMAEVIFGKGKTPEQIVEIASRLLDRGPNVLVTRTIGEVGERMKARYPETEFFPASGVLRVWRDQPETPAGDMVVVSAGTTDLFVAEEAFLTAQTMGSRVELIQDIGVAGIHRLLHNRERLTRARVVVVCAGMEGALPSAVGGMVHCPVIAVPTSVGYGASFNGLAALLGMLNSCASNVTVVNIDNGFGAGYVASMINRM